MPIPWTDTQFWCNTFDLDEQMAEGVHDAIRILDTRYVEVMVERRAAAEKRANQSKARR